MSCLSAQENIQWDFANSVDTIGFFQTPQFSCASMTQRAMVIIDCWLTLRTVVSLADEAVEQTTGCLAWKVYYTLARRVSNGASSLGNSCRNSLCGRNGAVVSLNLDKTRNLNTIRQVILINVCVNSIYTWICKMTQKHRAWRRRQAASYSPNTP